MTQGRIQAIKKERIKKSDLLFYCSMLVIPILNLIVFYFYGNANSFLLAVKAYDIDKAVPAISDGKKNITLIALENGNFLNI